MSQRLGFSIAGAQKCGTTALDAYLRRHPALSMGRDKESHFFDRETGVDWRTPDYDILHQAYADDDGRLRGDATPVTLFWTPAQYRMLAYNPQMRFIILLRDPAERAYSHWKMIRGRGQEPLPFGEAIREGRVRTLNEGAQSMAARWFSYVERGFYARQLKHLASLFGWERLLILRQDDLSAQPEATLARVTDFLGVPPLGAVPPERRNVSADTEVIGEDDRAYLNALYRDDLEELRALTGLAFD